MTLVEELAADTRAEGEDLEDLAAALPDWGRPTAAPGWSVRDTLTHLHASDLAALVAVYAPTEFAARLPALADDVLSPRFAGSDGELRDAWRTGRRGVVDAVRALPAGARLAWFGPPMGAASFLTARLMETWAHGQDIADAAGVTRVPGPRLRHIAELGVRTRDWSYAVHGRAAPRTPVHVALQGPDGSAWTWGPPDAADSVRGPALDFCLLVTQRRHRTDLALEITGAAAEEWMGLAQAFAGPPGPGRPPAGRTR
ncbi:MAG: TIGR03084 family metal-binding protein [Mycobacteriales bacterium]